MEIKKVGRAGITYEQVANAIDELTASGINPTIQSIRTHLGTGSPNTIHRHLTAWRSAAPVASRKVVELPEELKVAIIAEIEKQAAASRAVSEKELISTKEEAVTLAETGEQLEKENQRLEDKNQLIESENQQLVQQQANAKTLSDEHKQRISVLEQELEAKSISFQSRNDELVQQLATDRARLTMLQEQIEQLTAAAAEAKQAALIAKQEVSVARQEVSVARQEAAVAVAKQEAAAEAKQTATKLADDLQQQLTAQQAAAAKKLDDLQQQLTAQQAAALAALQQQLNTQAKPAKKASS